MRNFLVEKPRPIAIAIEGYNPLSAAADLALRFKRTREKAKKRAAKEAALVREAEDKKTQAEFDALAQISAVASSPVSPDFFVDAEAVTN